MREFNFIERNTRLNEAETVAARKARELKQQMAAEALAISEGLRILGGNYPQLNIADQATNENTASFTCNNGPATVTVNDDGTYTFAGQCAGRPFEHWSLSKDDMMVAVLRLLRGDAARK